MTNVTRRLGVLIAAAFSVAACSPAYADERQAVRALSDHTTTAGTSDQTARRKHLAGVKSWGYQLRLIDPEAIAASRFDLFVTDHAISANRRFVREFTPAEVERMKTRPDGSRRIVLAYLSIGEAERYRFYWRQEWYEPGKAPAWLAAANDRWDGNWRVRFWQPGWQDLIYAASTPGAATYLARIKAQGFDGIYLDRADVYAELLPERGSAETEMVRFIQRLAETARRDAPQFLVVMQNAEELIARRDVREAIDAIAKEDLLYGVEHDETANPRGMVAESLSLLRRARSNGLAVFAVEYLSDAVTAGKAAARLDKEGIVPLVAERSLGTLDYRAEGASAPP